MKISLTATTAFAMTMAQLVAADFYLYSGSLNTPDDPEGWTVARAVGVASRHRCDEIDNSPSVGGASGDRSYPWTENTLRVDTCGASMNFIRNGNDYNIYRDGAEIGHCVRGDGVYTPCFWGYIGGGYIEDYVCHTGVCA
ncbi:hypothetical protein DL96DRAFT_1609482 [Flagelloscypha sp. PMI_526]|nr:hypothetical protein DL96DRAFT_1609482 [Flagelloscypha sp. PMI_526]